MMQAMRHPRTLKYGLWAVLIIIIPSFVAFYGFGDSGSGSGRDALATMKLVEVELPSGTRELTRSDLAEAQQDLANQYARVAAAAFGQQADPDRIGNALKRREVAEHAVALAGFDELAKEEGIFVSREMVSKFLAESGWTSETFKNYLDMTGMSEQQAIENFRKSMRMDRSRAAISRMARVSLLEMWTEHKLAKERFSLEYVKVPYSKYRADAVATEEEIAAYFEANKDRYVKREERIYRYVAVQPPPVASIQIEEADIEAEYAKIDWNLPEAAPYKQQPGLEVRHIMVKATEDKTAEVVRGTLEGLRARIEAGEDFATIANDYTEDIQNIDFSGSEQIGKRGGLLTTRVHADTLEQLAGEYGEQWTEAAFGMLPAQLSGVVESNGAFYLIRGEKTYEERKTLDECRSQLQTAIRERRMAAEREKQKAFIDEAEGRLKTAVAQSTTLDAIARAMETEVKETSPTLTTRTSIPELGSFNSNAEALKALEKGIPGPVMRTDARGDAAQTLAVLEVAEVLPERPNTLDEVRASVEIAVKGEKAKARAKEIAEAVRAAVEGGKTMVEAAKEHELEAKDTTEPFELSSPPADFQMIQSVLMTDLFLAKAGDLKVVESPLEEMVYRVAERQEPDVAKFLQEMGDLEKELNAAKGMAFIDEYQRQTVKSVKAEYDPNFVAEEDPRVARRRARRAAAAGS